MEVIFCQVLVFIILSQCDADYSWQNRLFGQIYCRCDLSGKNAAKNGPQIYRWIIQRDRCRFSAHPLSQVICYGATNQVLIHKGMGGKLGKCFEASEIRVRRDFLTKNLFSHSLLRVLVFFQLLKSIFTLCCLVWIWVSLQWWVNFSPSVVCFALLSHLMAPTCPSVWWRWPQPHFSEIEMTPIWEKNGAPTVFLFGVIW